MVHKLDETENFCDTLKGSVKDSDIWQSTTNSTIQVSLQAQFDLPPEGNLASGILGNYVLHGDGSFSSLQPYVCH